MQHNNGGGGGWPRSLKEGANNFFPNLRLYDQQTTNDTSKQIKKKNYIYMYIQVGHQDYLGDVHVSIKRIIFNISFIPKTDTKILILEQICNFS